MAGHAAAYLGLEDHQLHLLCHGLSCDVSDHILGCCRGVVRRGMQWWLGQAAALLGLEDYLLRRPGPPVAAGAQVVHTLLPTSSCLDTSSAAEFLC